MQIKYGAVYIGVYLYVCAYVCVYLYVCVGVCVCVCWCVLGMPRYKNFYVICHGELCHNMSYVMHIISAMNKNFKPGARLVS